MIDDQLAEQIGRSAKTLSTVSELSDAEANVLLDIIADEFVENPQALWWWTSLRQPSQTIEYQGLDVFHEIRKLVSDDEVAHLVVTDDEPRPWLVFKGQVDDLLHVVGEQRYFEYFLIFAVSDKPNKVIFDTHHNSLVVAEKDKLISA
jgi:hypothetical protein